MAWQPTCDFRIEVIVHADIRFIEHSPRAFIGPELDAIFPQTVLVGHTVVKEQTKGRQVLHGVCLEARVIFKDAAPELLAVAITTRAAAEIKRTRTRGFSSFQSQKHPRYTWAPKAISLKNISKRKPRPKRNVQTPGDDHELGLWIDTDVLRRHHNHHPQTILHDPQTSTNSRYLELAALVLGNGKPKKKSKSSAKGAGS
jgi:hypothetical protein